MRPLPGSGQRFAVVKGVNRPTPEIRITYCSRVEKGSICMASSIAPIEIASYWPDGAYHRAMQAESLTFGLTYPG